MIVKSTLIMLIFKILLANRLCHATMFIIRRNYHYSHSKFCIQCFVFYTKGHWNISTKPLLLGYISVPKMRVWISIWISNIILEIPFCKHKTKKVSRNRKLLIYLFGQTQRRKSKLLKTRWNLFNSFKSPVLNDKFF